MKKTLIILLFAISANTINAQCKSKSLLVGKWTFKDYTPDYVPTEEQKNKELEVLNKTYMHFKKSQNMFGEYDSEATYGDFDGYILFEDFKDTAWSVSDDCSFFTVDKGLKTPRNPEDDSHSYFMIIELTEKKLIFSVGPESEIYFEMVKSDD